MIADHETNVVFVADTLEPRFPSVHVGLRTILGQHGIPLRTIPGTRDIWCRDYLPIQVAEDRFVQFRYAPDYLSGKHRHLRIDGRIGPTLPWVEDCRRSEIVLDGGNVVRWTDKVIVCDKLFDENPALKSSELRRRLGLLFGVDEVVVIPTEPGDVVGHADGVVRFAGPARVLVNDYRRVHPSYGEALRMALARANLEVIAVPHRPAAGRVGDIPSAIGCYLNYLQVGRVLILPRFGRPEDRVVEGLVRDLFPDIRVIGLECRELAAEGGAIHCVTWNVSPARDGNLAYSGPMGGA